MSKRNWACNTGPIKYGQTQSGLVKAQNLGPQLTDSMLQGQLILYK